jgi:hypothetical protein
MEVAHHITRHPVTDEITWEPTQLERELERMGLIERRRDADT